MLNDKELERYYEGQFDLFLHEGWKDFQEDVQKLKDSLPTVTHINTVEQLHMLKGQLDILDWILARKANCTEAYRQLSTE